MNNNNVYPRASKASWEVANLTKRKNPDVFVNGVKEFVHLSFTKDGLIFTLTRTKNH